MVNTKRFLKFGRDLAKKDPKVTSGKVAKLWNILQDFRKTESKQMVNRGERGKLLDLRI